MNISYNWLKDLIEIDVSAENVANALTRVGLAVEGIEQAGDDRIFDIDLTSNRPDCLSHLGVARELSVSLRKPVRKYDGHPAGHQVGPDQTLVSVQDPELCHRFTAQVIRGVKVAPSPEWLVERLAAIGERSINNVADITNYVMHELGQPMHAFDLDRLSQNRIVVRTARTGERITTLDEADRQLEPTMLAICDAEKPAAVAGIMGGAASSITQTTTNVLLEVAYFDRANIRETSRKLGLATEASYRFERGVDIGNLVAASRRATEMIIALAGGTVSEFVDVYPARPDQRVIECNDVSGAVGRLTGLSVTEVECREILSALGISSDGSSQFVVPTWRHDLAIAEDLVEEIARHVGYESIAEELPPAFSAGEYQPAEGRKRRLRQTMADLGISEAISYSFIGLEHDDIFQTAPTIANAAGSFVTLCDSVIEGAVRMRPSLLPGLLEAVRLNFNHQRRNVKLFEIGRVFAAVPGESGLPLEREVFGVVMTGNDVLANRAGSGQTTDFYSVKGAIDAALEAAVEASPRYEAVEIRHLRNGQAASISVNGSIVGYVGRLSDEIAAGYKFRQPVYVAELDLEAVLASELAPVVYQPLPRYPSIVRDISFQVFRDVTFSDAVEAVRGQDFELLREVWFVDIYEGPGVPEDQRSLTIRLEYRSDERTLMDDEVDEVHGRIVAHAQQVLRASARTQHKT